MSSIEDILGNNNTGSFSVVGLLQNMVTTLQKILGNLEKNPDLNQVKAYYNFEQVVSSGPLTAQCNAISFLNQGTTNVTIGTLLLQPGDPMISFTNGNSDLDMTTYNITFSGAGDNNLVVIKRNIKGNGNYYETVTINNTGR